MKRILKKAVAMALAVCMLLAMTPEAYAASTIQISASKLSSSYKGSIFYTRANEAYNKYKNASDAERFVRVALSQKGYKGSTKNGDYNGVGDNIGTYNEYSRYWKVNGQPWCASFVSWCSRAAGISENVIETGTGCGHWRNPSANGGKFIKIWSNDFKTYKDYKPQVGDLVLFTPLCKTCDKHYTSFKKTSHVAIVCDVADERNKDGSWTFTTIERKGNTVGSRTLTTKSRRGKGSCACKSQKNTGITNVQTVQGFFHPVWADGKSAPNHLSNTDSASNNNNNNTNPAGKVTVTYPTDSAYLAKFSSTENNAVLVSKVTKPANEIVQYMGLAVYDRDGNLVSDKTFVPTVSASATSFHVVVDVKNLTGKTLKANSTYIYKFYAKVGNYDVVTSELRPFYTTKASTVQEPEKETIPVEVKYPTNSTYLAKFSVTTNNAVVVANITKPAGSTVNSVGLVVYEDATGTVVCDQSFPVTNVSASTTSFHAWFDIQKELGKTLQAGTKYKYRFYTKVDNVKYVGPYWYFTTKAAAASSGSGSSTSGSSSGSGGTTVTLPGEISRATNSTYKAKESVTRTNAVVVANIRKDAGTKVTEVGIVIRDDNWNLICDKSFPVTNVSNSTTSFHAWFDVQKELGVTLSPGTIYWYSFNALIDGKYVNGAYWKLTTLS
ncbi:MAG: CHAP domain-containing protein [Anaerovoracaceae bacterium]|nr:CHAP domain-containing protein [Anaerovoracaceae bacterium]